MVFYRYPPPDKAPQSQTSRPRPPDSQLVWKKADDQIRTSDKYLLDTGYMSDCTVICEDSKWNAHKSILCSRNNWFRDALTRDVQEDSPGVVAIEDTDPDVVQIVLEAIYAGEINCYFSTPSDIIEVWRAGDSFGIRDLRWEAENAMFRRLRASTEFLSFHQRPNTKTREDQYCKVITVRHKPCGHFTRETRVCPVSTSISEGGAVFHVCEPQAIDFRYSYCDLCEKRMRDEMESDDYLDGLRDAAAQRSGRCEPPAESPQPDDEIRELIMGEIKGLCAVLNLVVEEPTKGSCIHEALINHVCNTPVAAWWGFTVCKLLKQGLVEKKLKYSVA